jgi:hypothetical protein
MFRIVEKRGSKYPFSKLKITTAPNQQQTTTLKFSSELARTKIKVVADHKNFTAVFYEKSIVLH